MTVTPNAELITFIGVVTQMTAVSMLSIVFLLLNRLAERKEYFSAWVFGWIFMALSLVLLVPSIANGRLTETLVLDGGEVGGNGWTIFSITGYMLARLLALTYLLAGVLQFCRHFSLRPYLGWMLPGIIAYTLLTMVMAVNALQVAAWLAVPTVMVATYSAWLLWRLPRPRRSLGTRTSTAAFLLLAIAWVFFLPAFSHYAVAPGHSHAGWRVLVTQYNGFIDTLLAILMAIGMVLILLEDTLLEVRSAYRELTNTHEALRRESFIDPLTTALNRRAFEEGYGLETARASFGTIVMLDLDDLKPVNDEYGHEAGDRLLRWVTAALRSNLRPTDKLYRWGGDEFLLVLPRASAAAAVTRLREILEEMPSRPVAPGSEHVRPGVSIGAAQFEGGDGIEDAIQLADEAMYADKKLRKSFISTHPQPD